ncbi:ATP-binding protein [Azorhizobium doebereinerae]|uniref:ATP-binding protein n=1 Tax=Azorhizobium doebereinerae TaxID=281091 RepID=UPI00040F2439|nr:ATP-binding protein [Azorhizobium doebereinerae]
MTTPLRDTSSNKNLFLLAQLRWLAVAGQVFTIMVVHIWFHIPLPLQEMVSVLLFLVALNLVTLWRHRRSETVTNAELFFELLLDVAALTIQLYLSGGAANPFISLYLLQIGLGAVLLETWSAWTLVLIAGGCFVWLTTTFRPLTLPDAPREGLFDLHIGGMFVCFLLAASLLVQFITRINANLRARDTHLADLRQKSAEEDHIVRIGLLASGAAHELGTPLATLSVILNDWRHMAQFSSDPDLAEEMAEMQNQLDRCKAIVSGILMSSGEARGEGTLHTTAGAFFDEVIAEWRASRSPAHLEYRNTIDEGVAIISDHALKQVIFNVFDNALEASPDWVRVSVRRQGEELVLTVRDQGGGFAEEILSEFGKPYRSTKNRPGGGLGLFLVVNVVRKLGGSVRAMNGDRGASVTLNLPLSALTPDGRHGA